MKTGVTVGDAMSQNPIIITPDKNISQCASLMVKKNVGSIIVKAHDRVLGIITEKDIVNKVVAKNLSPIKTKVTDIMTRQVITIRPEQDIYVAMIEMSERHLRRMPVIHNGKIVGMITVRDIMRVQPRLFDLLVERYRAGQQIPLL